MYETCKNTHKLICNTFEAQKSVVSNDLTTYFVLKWKLIHLYPGKHRSFQGFVMFLCNQNAHSIWWPIPVTIISPRFWCEFLSWHGRGLLTTSRKVGKAKRHDGLRHTKMHMTCVWVHACAFQHGPVIPNQHPSVTKTYHMNLALPFS